MTKRADALEQLENQAPTRFDRSIALAALADWWLVKVGSTQVRPSSLAKYEERVGRTKKGLGRTPVADLRSISPLQAAQPSPQSGRAAQHLSRFSYRGSGAAEAV
jgi:hypothetical protein